MCLVCAKDDASVVPELLLAPSLRYAPELRYGGPFAPAAQFGRRTCMVGVPA